MKTLRTVLCLLLATVARAGVSPEIAVSVPEIANAPYAKNLPAVASNGRDFFVIWSDERSGRGAGLFGTRVTRAGEVLDPAGIRIADSGQGPRVVWNGEAWVVTWTQRVTVSDERPRIKAARIETDGRVTKTIEAAQRHSELGSYVASNGTYTVILYFRYDTSEVRSAVLDRNLEIVGDHHIAPTGQNRYHLSLTAIGNGFFAAWNNTSAAVHGSIEGVRLDREGKPVTGPRLLGAGYDPEVAESEDDTVVVLLRHAAAQTLVWSTRQVRADLTHFATARPLALGEYLYSPTLLRVGGGYVVISQQFDVNAYRVAATRLDAAGVPIDGNPQPITSIRVEPLQAAIPPSPTAATNGDDLLVVWLEPSGSAFQGAVRAQLLDATTFEPRTEILPLSNSARLQITPAVAFDGTNHLVVWRDDTGIFASRVAADGRTLDGPGFRVGGSYASSYPAVVFDGRSYIVAWTEQGGFGLIARFIDPVTTLGPERVRTDFHHGQISMATNGATTVVTGAFGDRIYGIRLGRDSQLFEGEPTLISPFQVLPATGPVIAWNGEHFLVAWLELELDEDSGGILHPFPIRTPMRVRGTRVSPSLLVRDPEAIVLGDAPGPDGSPALASLNGDWLLVWTASQFGAVRARRIGADLTLYGDPTGIGLGLGINPTVTSDGTRFVVAQRDGYNTNLHLTYLTRDLIQTNRFAFDAGITAIGRIGLAPARGGATAVVYSHISPAPEHGHVERTYLRLATPTKKARAVR